MLDIKLWTVDGSEVQRFGAFDVDSIAFSPDGKQLVTGHTIKTGVSGKMTNSKSKIYVKLWDIVSGKQIKSLLRHVGDANLRVAFHPNGKQIAITVEREKVWLWAVCDWSDRTNCMFPKKIKRVIFQLMCVKARLEKDRTQFTQILSMATWLDIMRFIHV
jgi:WD40 repeat protein